MKRIIFISIIAIYTFSSCNKEAPVVEAPVVEAPVVEAPVVEAPVVEAPVVEAPLVQNVVIHGAVESENNTENELPSLLSNAIVLSSSFDENTSEFNQIVSVPTQELEWNIKVVKNPMPAPMKRKEEYLASAEDNESHTEIEQVQYNEDELFAQIFGLEVEEIPTFLYIPIILENLVDDEIQIIMKDDEIQIDSHKFLDLIGNYVKSDKVKEIRNYIKYNDNLLTQEVLTDAGFSSKFNDDTLIMNVSIPNDYLVETTYAVNEKRTHEIGFINNANISAVANVSLYESVSYSSSDISYKFNPELETFFNMFGVVAETRVNHHNIDGDTTYNTIRDSRVVYDDINSSVRYSFGEISSPGLSFLKSSNGLGFNISRNFLMDPKQSVIKQNGITFELERRSRVEVIVNGVQVDMVTLLPGTHSLDGIYLSNGSNDVTLIVTDDLGQTDELNFPFYIKTGLNNIEQFPFALSVNFSESDDIASEDLYKTYDFSNMNASGFVKLPILDNFNLTLFSQASSEVIAGGFHSFLGTEFGNIQFEYGNSNNKNYGFSARLKYSYFSPSSRWFLSAMGEYISSDFVTILNPSYENEYEYKFSASSNFRMTENVSFSSGTNYNISRDDDVEDSINVTFGVGVNLNDWKLSSNLEYSLYEEDPVVTNISLSYSFPESKQRLNSKYNSSAETLSGSWLYNGKNSYLNASVESAYEYQNVSMIFNNKSAFHTFSNNLEGSFNNETDTSDMNASSNFGSSIVFADGLLGLSAPINDSFVVVDRTKNTEGLKVGLNPKASKYSAESIGFLPPVMPITSYTKSSILIEVPDLMLGTDIGQEEYFGAFRYKSASVFEIGADENLAFAGYLVQKDGNPVVYEAGELKSLDDDGFIPKLMFTDDQGNFFIEGVAPGRYMIELYSGQTHEFSFDNENIDGLYTFVVDDKSEGYVSLGEIRPVETASEEVVAILRKNNFEL